MKKIPILLGLLLLVFSMVAVVQAPPPGPEQSAIGSGMTIDSCGFRVVFELYADENTGRARVIVVVRGPFLEGSLLRMQSTGTPSICIVGDIGHPVEISGEALVWYGGSITTGSFSIKGYDNDGAGADELYIPYINDGTADVYWMNSEATLIGGNIEIRGQV